MRNLNIFVSAEMAPPILVFPSVHEILVPHNVSTGNFICSIWVGGHLKIVNQPAAGGMYHL